jgi:hypothetical protein
MVLRFRAELYFSNDFAAYESAQLYLSGFRIESTLYEFDIDMRHQLRYVIECCPIPQ